MTDLPVDTIVCGDCPREVCRVCGKPRERVVNRKGGTTGKSWHDHAKDMEAGQSQGSHPGGVDTKEAKAGNPYVVETVGWTDCIHHDYRPSTVLDPFSGSGTVGVVAAKLKPPRDYLLMEINPQYVGSIAQQRLEAAERGLDREEINRGQLALFREQT